MDENPKIELVRDPDAEELDSAAPASTTRLNQWLATLVSRGGSDLLLVTGVPACLRVNGECVAIGTEPLRGEQIEAAVRPALGAHGLAQYQKDQIADS